MDNNQIKTPLDDLKIWVKSIEFSEKHLPFVFSISNFGVRDQLSRSIFSVSSNIAEGYGRYSNKDFARFLRIAVASSFEVESQLRLAKKVGLLKELDLTTAISDLCEIRKMLFGFIHHLDKS